MKRKKVEVDGIIQIKRGKKIDTWIHQFNYVIARKKLDMGQLVFHTDIYPDGYLRSNYPTGVWGG